MKSCNRLKAQDARMNQNKLNRDSRSTPESCPATNPACPVCGGRLVDIRGKLQCTQCHRICETCCEGGRG
jgi:hypothetical protein